MPLPSYYDQTLAKARDRNMVIREGTEELFDYFFFMGFLRPEDEGKMEYCYMGKLKDTDDVWFSASSAVSRMEAEKQFKAMKMWFSEEE